MSRTVYPLKLPASIKATLHSRRTDCAYEVSSVLESPTKGARCMKAAVLTGFLVLMLLSAVVPLSAFCWGARPRRALREFAAHYHRERNEGLGNELIDGVASTRSDGGIRCRPRLGGLLNFYDRAA